MSRLNFYLVPPHAAIAEALVHEPVLPVELLELPDRHRTLAVRGLRNSEEVHRYAVPVCDRGQPLHGRVAEAGPPVKGREPSKVEDLLGLCQDMIKDTKGIVHG